MVQARRALVFAGGVLALAHVEPGLAQQPSESIKASVERHAKANGIPPELAHAVVTVESRYNPNARGSGGVMGLMQIKHRTAMGIGYRGSAAGLLDAETNLQYGMRYLAGAYKLAGGDTCGTIVKYSGGHRASRMNSHQARYCSKVKSIMAGNTPKTVMAAASQPALRAVARQAATIEETPTGVVLQAQQISGAMSLARVAGLRGAPALPEALPAVDFALLETSAPADPNVRIMMAHEAFSTVGPAALLEPMLAAEADAPRVMRSASAGSPLDARP